MRFHIHASKSYLVKLVQEKGAAYVLRNFEGTQDEAIAAILDDPRDVFTLSECDNCDETGHCQGHDESIAATGGQS